MRHSFRTMSPLGKGIKKRIAPARLEIKKFKNARYNRYVYFQLKYMSKLNNEQYWRHVGQLFRYSNVFWYQSLIHVKPKWHRENPYWCDINLVKRARKLYGSTTEFVAARVYIPKPNNKKRPLPFREGGAKYRMKSLPMFIKQISYLPLHIFNVRVKNKISKHQHGFVPGRGCMTAWIEILKNVINDRDNYMR
jgi:hypothetical protein